MFKKGLLTLLCFLFTCQTGFCFSISPEIQAGIDSNDNIDQNAAPSSDLNSFLSGSVLYKCISDQDIYFENSINFGYRKFMKDSYGSIGQGSTIFNVDYGFSERINIGAGGTYSFYSDSALPGNNYTLITLMPRLSYKISPVTAVSLNLTPSTLNYSASGEIVSKMKEGASVHHFFSDSFSINLGGYFSSGDSNINMNDSRSAGIQGSAFLSPIDRHRLKLALSYEAAKFPNWTICREDNTTSLNLECRSGFAENFDFIGSYFNIERRSTDPNYAFKNNIFSVSFCWKTVFGELYPEGIDSEIGYYYNKGLSAIDEKQWLDAEKYFRRVVFLADQSDQAHFQLGYSLNKQQKHIQSCREFEKAIELNPANIEAHYLLAYNYLKLAEKNKARAVLEKLILLKNDEKINKILNSLPK